MVIISYKFNKSGPWLLGRIITRPLNTYPCLLGTKVLFFRTGGKVFLSKILMGWKKLLLINYNLYCVITTVKSNNPYLSPEFWKVTRAFSASDLAEASWLSYNCLHKTSSLWTSWKNIFFCVKLYSR